MMKQNRSKYSVRIYVDKYEYLELLDKNLIDHLVETKVSDFLLEPLMENIDTEWKFEPYTSKYCFEGTVCVLTPKEYEDLLFYKQLYLDMIANLENKNNP